MKKILLSVAIVLLALPSLVNAQSRFEGLVIYRFETNGKALIQKSWVRGDSVLIEAEAPMPPRSVVNFATTDYRVYKDDSTVLVKSTVKSFDAKPNITSHLKPVQQFDTINGKVAQLYQVGITVANRGRVMTSFWLTKQLSDNARIAIVRNLLIGSTDQTFRDIAHEILALGLAPIRLTVSAEGKNQLSMTVTSVTEQKIPNDKFSDF